MKIFGISLFEYKKPLDPMYDFAQHGLLNVSVLDENINITAYAVSNQAEALLAAEKLGGKKNKESREKLYLTPKAVYECKMLNDNAFKIKVDKDYIADQVKLIDEKIDFLTDKRKKKRGGRGRLDVEIYGGGMRFGREELISMKERLLSRFKLLEKAGWKNVFEEYPHTTNELITKVLEGNASLKCKLVGDFVPDLPGDAISAMKKYNKMCVEICNRESVFYVIAQTKDFEKISKRRDPILLAQSPFGFFWQILGAWDEEIVLLDQL